jgi:dihydrofolate reductase
VWSPHLPALLSAVAERPDSPFTPYPNAVPKYVASRTLSEPLPWMNSTLEGRSSTAVAALKRQQEKDLPVLGSGELVQSLMRANLVDAYVILIHPLVLGAGRRLFSADGPTVRLQLASSSTPPNGVIAATYGLAAPA